MINKYMSDFHISHELPPPHIYYACVSRFHADFDRGTVFTYGDTIYAKDLPAPDLIAHEQVHIAQQSTMGKEEWWYKYFDDPEFRLSQELEAYRAQYSYIKEKYNRDGRRAMLAHMAESLSNGYGLDISKEEALTLIIQ